MIIITIDPLQPDPAALQQALDILKSGGVLAYPTETFYGLGADARNEEAVERVFAAKGRDFNNPLPVIIGRKADLAHWVADIPDAAESLIQKFWPGPLTLVFRAARLINPRLTAATGKIAVRVSNHPPAAALAQSLRAPLTSTSANRSGAAECTNACAVIEQLGGCIDAVVDGGETPGGKGSTIVDVTVKPIKILREGAIPASAIVEPSGNQSV